MMDKQMTLELELLFFHLCSLIVYCTFKENASP